MADATRLVDLAEAFTNARVRRMRQELRHRIGAALGFNRRDWDALDCAESDDVFVVLKPKGRLSRASFLQHDPLLRQAVVAGCAATETYIADRVVQAIRVLVTRGTPTARMASVPLTFGKWLTVDGYERRKRAITDHVLEPYVRKESSTAANKVGELLTLVGIENWATKLDGARAAAKGTTVTDLDRVTLRRNRIAHEADRRGYSRGVVSVAEVRSDLSVLRSVVEAIEGVF